MKKQTVTKEEAEKLYSSEPTIIKGQWKTLCNEVKKSKQPVVVSDITRGQAYALKRQALEQGLRVKALEKGKKIVILPPEAGAGKA